MPDKTKLPRIIDAISVTFEDQTHLDLHAVLTTAGFAFEVFPPDFRVGLSYTHTVKHIEVELCLSADGEYRATTSDLAKPHGARINAEDSYTVVEWAWLEAAETELEFLRRELHILLHVRPKSLKQIPQE